jgi:hypothetical protein
MEIPSEDFERGLAAILPFVAAWNLPVNPEDLEEIVYAVLLHARSDRSFEEIDTEVRQQLAEYKFKMRRFQREAYGKKSPEEAAVGIVVELLVEGDYETVERATRNSRLDASDLRRAITEYGRTLSSPGESWWSEVSLPPIYADAGGGFHVAAPLWTEEEGRSDLTLGLRLTESAPKVYEVAVEDLHVVLTPCTDISPAWPATSSP